MNILFTILFFNFLGSVISLSGGILLLLKWKLAGKISHYLSSFAAGTLLGAVFFDLLPESTDVALKSGLPIQVVFTWTLVGSLFFFLLERLLHWFHHHSFEEHELRQKPIVPLIILGDTIHNFIDGIAITATFLVSIPLGIITTFAVGAHEIPQEIGDFGILLKKGLSKKKVIIINVLSAMASFLGIFVAYYYGVRIELFTVISLAITAGFFLYISLSDLIPEIHHENKKGLALKETLFLVIGIITIYLAIMFSESALLNNY